MHFFLVSSLFPDDGHHRSCVIAVVSVHSLVVVFFPSFPITKRASLCAGVRAPVRTGAGGARDHKQKFFQRNRNDNLYSSAMAATDIIGTHLVSALRAPTAEQNEKFWLSAEQNPKEPAQHYQKQQTKVVGLGCSIE